MTPNFVCVAKLTCIMVKTEKNKAYIYLHFNTLHFDTPRISGLIQRGLL